jgi:ferrous iron transport protein A
LQLATFRFRKFFQHLPQSGTSLAIERYMRDTAEFASPINLYEACDRADLRILLITGGWDVRRSFNQMGIQPGDRVRVLRRAPFGGPLVIDNKGTRVAVGKQLAEKIRVEVLP